MINVKKIIKNGSIGKAIVVGSVYAVGAVITKLTSDFYKKSLEHKDKERLE